MKLETTIEHGRLGHGKEVHKIIVWNDGHKHSACGSGASTHMHNWRRPSIKITTEAITCKKCLAK